MPDALTGRAVLLSIAGLRRDGGTQPRAMLDPSTVEAYADARRDGASFPPVVVFYDGTNHWLADGFHRTAGHEEAGEAEIEADIRPGTQRDAILFACGANATHGLRRTTGDKRRAVLLLLGDPEWQRWSDREIARHARVSNTFVGTLRAATVNVDSERTFQTRHGTVAKMDTAAIGRRAADMATLRSVPIDALHQLVSEQHRAKQERKKARRDERELQLGEKIAAGNAALAAAGAAGKRYGVIYADPEWRFEPWSRETGMDRAADNHYPTSPVEAIMARPVNAIAAHDSALFLWATRPMLPHALRVVEAWGFAYKSCTVWGKSREGDGRGPGYIFTDESELLLYATRGTVPAPAPGTQWPSLIMAPVGEHSAKPARFRQLIESYFPSLPKIELNAREAHEGWDCWGAEAPITIGVDLSLSPDQYAEVAVHADGSLTSREGQR
jgi:N6-adenosine-specific RNA methylase IME4